MDLLNVVAMICSSAVFVFVIELIRRGRLKERYALLWLFASAVLIVFSSSRVVLEFVSRIVGIFYPPSFLFLLAFLFLLLITLHFSIVISGLSEKNKRLAQEIALLRQILEEQAGRATTPAGNEGPQ
jgi:hypothetical protein